MVARVLIRNPLLVVIALLVCPPLGAAAQKTGARSLDVAPIEAEEPSISSARPSFRVQTFDRVSINVDGRLDEEAWAAIRPIRGFVQGEPVEGIPAEEDTEVRMIIDNEAIYIAARMFDSNPEEIPAQLVRRDEPGAFDWFAVSLDPNLDGRTGYHFMVSAAGVQTDQYLYDDDRADRAWDAVWQSEVQIDSLGWTAELRIPLSQIRYESSPDAQTWGVNFSRQREETNERSYFALQSRMRDGRVSQFGRLEGVRAAQASRRLEVRPYVLGSLHRGPAATGDPFFNGQSSTARTGADVSVGIGSAFSLDATIAPDFGQVEADPAVINLSAFETFQQERRPFFVEDAQIFDFGLSGRRNSLFYSRRIGRSPHGRAPAGANFSEVPDAATILGAAKITGRISSGLSMGALAAVTRAESGAALFVEGGRVESFLVEPRSEFGVLRVQQDFNDGMSQVGGIVTGMNRELPEDGSFDFLPGQAFTMGLQAEHQWDNRTWRLSGFLAGSHVRGDSTAMVRTKRASNHFFQRPDAIRQRVDSTATSLSGGEWRLRLDKQNGKHWTGGLWIGQVTDGFEVNDLGFSQSREKLDGGLRLSYRQIEPGDLFRNYGVSLWSFHNFSHDALEAPGSLSSWQQAYTSGQLSLNARGTFHNFWGTNLNIGFSPDTYSRTATRGGPIMKSPGQWSLQTGFNTDSRKAVSFQGDASWSGDRAGRGAERSFSGEVSFRPNPQLQIEVGPRVRVQTTAAQYVARLSDLGALAWEPTFGDRYIFGELDRTTVSMQTRVNWTFSPTLSLQLFAQPLLSAGDYTRYRQLAEAGSFRFKDFQEGGFAPAEGSAGCAGGTICTEVRDDGGRIRHLDLSGDGRADASFRDRDFSVRSLVGNAVVRWEYRPGSTLFLVWQREQAGRSSVGDFDLGRDLGELWNVPAENRFMVKINYWLDL